LYNAAATNYQNAQSRSFDASSAFGTSFNKLVNDSAAKEGSWLNTMDDKMNNWLGGKGWNVTPEGGWDG
jgi:hypothetical protein